MSSYTFFNYSRSIRDFCVCIPQLYSDKIVQRHQIEAGIRQQYGNGKITDASN